MTARRSRQTATDRCPGSLTLHEAADGWLARIRIPGGRLVSEQLRALSRAGSLGNGLVELTSRANVQLRGFPADCGELATILDSAGLLPSQAHDRVRNVVASPLSGRHPAALADTDSVVSELDAQLCADRGLAELSGRFLFAVDDGSGLALRQLADVALVACGERTYELVVSGRRVGHLPESRAPAAAVAAARGFLAERADRGAKAWRIADLGLTATASAPPGRPLLPGRLTQRDGRTAVTGLVPLGRLETGDLAQLAELAPEVRLGIGRTVTVLDLDRAEASKVERRLRGLGLVLEAGSGWVGLTACAGRGRCTRARLDVRAAAQARARTRLPSAPAEHWAACERRCGEARDQPVSVAALPEGLEVRMPDARRLAGGVDEALAVLG